MTSERIYLTYLNGTGYVFNVNDYMTIRKEYRIAGSLVGTCNTRGWSPNVNGLPAELTKFETQLLIEKEFAVVVRKSCLREKPTQEIIEKYKIFREERIRQQESFSKAQKLNDSKKNINKIIEGKKKKLLKSGITENDINLTTESVLKDIEDNIVFDKNNALEDIPYEYPFDHEVEIVNFPSDNSFKYRVFKDLWEKGKYITSGESFGADFLVYPGDPLAFHASHLIIIIENGNIQPLELIGKGRLSVIVNKICTFAYPNENRISYQTLHWEGSKERSRNEPGTSFS